jgi:hypothetical protein
MGEPALLYVRGKKPDANRQIEQGRPRRQQKKKARERERARAMFRGFIVNCQSPFVKKGCLDVLPVQWKGWICPGESQGVGYLAGWLAGWLAGPAIG